MEKVHDYYTKPGADCQMGPIVVTVPDSLPYEDMEAYIRSWPDKLVAFVADRLPDGWMGGFARELYEYICQADSDGPAFESWRAS